jgi:hypothetical protein
MDRPARIIGIAPQLVVPGVATTAEYYRDALGFSIIGYFLDSLVYAMVQRDGPQLHFGKADCDSIKTKTIGSPAAVGLVHPHKLLTAFCLLPYVVEQL